MRYYIDFSSWEIKADNQQDAVNKVKEIIRNNYSNGEPNVCPEICNVEPIDRDEDEESAFENMEFLDINE